LGFTLLNPTYELLRAIISGLIDENYDVSCAGDGAEALALFKSNQYDLVISDIRMPVMDGLQLLQEIMIIKPNAKVIMFTAYSNVESYREAMSRGAIEYIQKPVNLSEFRKIVRKSLNNSKRDFIARIKLKLRVFMSKISPSR
jgi:DNA-binding NtrC family response regulator